MFFLGRLCPPIGLEITAEDQEGRNLLPQAAIVHMPLGSEPVRVKRVVTDTRVVGSGAQLFVSLIGMYPSLP